MSPRAVAVAGLAATLSRSMNVHCDPVGSPRRRLSRRNRELVVSVHLSAGRVQLHLVDFGQAQQEEPGKTLIGIRSLTGFT
jgi:hypothetical protein